MIISKTPLRLTLGGGGTDLPSYYSRFGGFVVAAALDRYVYLAVKRRFENGIRVSYSVTEIVNSNDEVKHPLVRETLRFLELKEHLEIVSIADVPSKTGLGSSGSFTVGLLHALHAYKDENPPRSALAEEACHVEMKVLKEPSGKQDPYIAAFGGFMCIDITRNGSTNVYPLRIPPDVASELENNTLFFYTGITREASEVLQSQKNALEENHIEALDAMHSIRDIGFRVKKTLEKGNLIEYGKLQHEHWLAKKRVTNRMSTQLIDRWYNLGLESGAMGGKLMGAGGGGFLMFYCENGKDKLRKAMAEEGLAEVKFGFERNGSKIIINL